MKKLHEKKGIKTTRHCSAEGIFYNRSDHFVVVVIFVDDSVWF